MNSVQNTFHFHPISGLQAGLPVSLNVPTSRNDGSVHPPHVKCGSDFIIIDNVNRPQMQTIRDKKRVMSASVRTVRPVSGRSEFKTLSRYQNSDNIVLVELQSFDHRVKDAFSSLEAWVGLKADSGIETIVSDWGGVILLFTKDAQEVDVYLGNGSVYRLQQVDGTIKLVPLSYKEMAELRVAQFSEQLAGLEGPTDIVAKRRDGILWGASRLLRASLKDREVREVLIDFLVEHRSEMSNKLCQEVRHLLLSMNDLRAGDFLWGDNIIPIKSEPSAEGRLKRAEADKKRQARRQRDQLDRVVKKGPSNGGQKRVGKRN